MVSQKCSFTKHLASAQQSLPRWHILVQQYQCNSKQISYNPTSSAGLILQTYVSSLNRKSSLGQVSQNAMGLTLLHSEWRNSWSFGHSDRKKVNFVIYIKVWCPQFIHQQLMKCGNSTRSILYFPYVFGHTVTWILPELPAFIFYSTLLYPGTLRWTQSMHYAISSRRSD